MHDRYHGPGGVHEQMRRFRQPLETLLHSVDVRHQQEERRLARKQADLNRTGLSEREENWLYTDIAMCLHTLQTLAEEEWKIRELYNQNKSKEARTSGTFWNQCYIDDRGSLRIL